MENDTKSQRETTPLIIKEEDISNPIKLQEKKTFKLTPIKPYPILALLAYVGMLFFYITPILTFLSSLAFLIYFILQVISNFGILKFGNSNIKLESSIMTSKTIIGFISYGILVLICFISICNGAFSFDFISTNIYGPECKLNAGYLIMYLIPLLATPGCYWSYLYLVWNKKKWDE